MKKIFITVLLLCFCMPAFSENYFLVEGKMTFGYSGAAYESDFVKTKDVGELCLDSGIYLSYFFNNALSIPVFQDVGFGSGFFWSKYKFHIDEPETLYGNIIMESLAVPVFLSLGRSNGFFQFHFDAGSVLYFPYNGNLDTKDHPYTKLESKDFEMLPGLYLALTGTFFFSKLRRSNEPTGFGFTGGISTKIFFNDALKTSEHKMVPWDFTFIFGMTFLI